MEDVTFALHDAATSCAGLGFVDGEDARGAPEAWLACLVFEDLFRNHYFVCSVHARLGSCLSLAVCDCKAIAK